MRVQAQSAARKGATRAVSDPLAARVIVSIPIFVPGKASFVPPVRVGHARPQPAPTPKDRSAAARATHRPVRCHPARFFTARQGLNPSIKMLTKPTVVIPLWYKPPAMSMTRLCRRGPVFRSQNPTSKRGDAMAAAASPHGTPSEASVDLMAEGTRVVMAPGKRWQGVGTINRMHDNGMRSGVFRARPRQQPGNRTRAHVGICAGTTCAVKWDSGRLDRSLLLADLIVKKVRRPARETVEGGSERSGAASPCTCGAVRLEQGPDAEAGVTWACVRVARVFWCLRVRRIAGLLVRLL